MSSRSNIPPNKPKKVRRNWGQIAFVIFCALMAIMFLLEPILQFVTRSQ
jgi:hypothetical protein